MQILRLLSAVAVFFLVAISPVSSLANDLESIAPFIDEHTLAVVSVDLSGIDLPSLQKQYLDPLARTDADRVAVSVAVGQVDEWLKRFRADGVRQVYLVATTAQLPQLSLQHPDDIIALAAFLVLPGAKAETLRELQARFEPFNEQMRRIRRDGPTLKSSEIHGAGIVAFDRLLDMLAAQKPQPRPEFATALAAVGNRPLRLAVAAPPLFARAAEEILLDPLPGANKPLGPIIARGLKWASIGVEPDINRFNAQLVIQSADATAAKDLADTLNRAIVMASSKLAEEGRLQGMVGGALLTTFAPTVDNDRLVLTLDQQRAAGLRQFATAALQASRAGAERNRTQNNLKFIGLALQNYEDKKKHQPDRAIRDKNGSRS